jgi:hypothetical protein
MTEDNTKLQTYRTKRRREKEDMLQTGLEDGPESARGVKTRK